ncbi:2-keto-4-pentenoate hydratase [Oceanicoccus sp. KOV_DT_Chl]|uniref:2-keto-4-pentenoate hydratase n=1 Tax=Oceanicoccus sp. KOV_DT_Chl TaxID=1904639 RepID=UPI000C7C3705|nr:fumarylacetoacetate hydrolase family protein [Oceanicoccus sp. KOV_DT_Chl]
MIDTAAVAQIVDDAAHTAQAIGQLSETGYALTLAEAYEVQAWSMARRVDRGEKIIGVKMGFTSKAKMVQMGVADLIWGRLTDAMLLEDGGELNLSNYVHPRIEPEIVFRLSKPLTGEVTLLEAMAAVDAIAPAMEVIDSRYENFKFSLEDVVADNSSSSGLVIGAWQSVPEDISNLGIAMEFNGKPVQVGSSAAIMGNPYRSLVAAARLAAEAGMVLEKGWVVMAGAATAAEALMPGVHVRMVAEKLGCVEITVNGE